MRCDDQGFGEYVWCSGTDEFPRIVEGCLALCFLVKAGVPMAGAACALSCCERYLFLYIASPSSSRDGRADVLDWV